MKRMVLLGLVLLSLVGTIACDNPLVVKVYAQSLPITKNLDWDDTANATSYIVRLDGTQISTPSASISPFTITTVGVHTLSVAAVNTWGSSAFTPLVINVILPAAPANLKVTD